MMRIKIQVLVNFYLLRTSFQRYVTVSKITNSIVGFINFFIFAFFFFIMSMIGCNNEATIYLFFYGFTSTDR